MKGHNGYTLIECLATIALVGTAMTTVAVSMSSVQRTCQRVRVETVSEMQWQRFATQLRADAHVAMSAELETGADVKTPTPDLRLILDGDEVVRYVVNSGELQREHRRNDQVLHRETYQLPEACEARWEVNTGNSTPVVSILLEPRPGDHSGRIGGEALQVSAAVGLLTRPGLEAKE